MTLAETCDDIRRAWEHAAQALNGLAARLSEEAGEDLRTADRTTRVKRIAEACLACGIDDAVFVLKQAHEYGEGRTLMAPESWDDLRIDELRDQWRREEAERRAVMG